MLNISLPIPLDCYPISNSLCDTLLERIRCCPFNLFATLIFFLAIIHTFLAPLFQKLAQRFPSQSPKDQILRTLFHFLGEIEVIFGLWMIPLAIGIVCFYGYDTMTQYFHNVNYTESMFIVVIMAIASSKPILQFAEICMKKFANLGGATPKAWWFSILIIGPLLGSFITEPAAITISSLLLAKQFYQFNPSMAFRYATLGLLFVNVSVGGVLTNFAAPPVLMIAGKWNWDTAYMFMNFGIRSLSGIIIATSLYGFIFRKEFHRLQTTQNNDQTTVPAWIICVHLFFLVWTIFNIHTPALFLLGFLFFLGFTTITSPHQSPINLKSPILVGFFLAGLVTHGGLQQWWIEALLGKLNDTSLFFGATILTAFNDNAAITYLSSLVPSIAKDTKLQHAVVSGAITGGGLTVIANAPNPAGQSILQPHFQGKVSPLKLFLGALSPTIILAICFLL